MRNYNTKNRDFSHKSSQREEYKRIARDTLEIIDDGFYGGPPAVVYLPLVDYEEVICISPEDAENMRCEVLADMPAEHDTAVFITPVDSYRLAYELKNGLVMNFANAYNPGGGFLKGSNAQEECLCRESSLYKSIGSRKAAEMYRYNKRLDSPVASDYMLISPKVCVFRDLDDYFLNKPFWTSVVTVPAIDLRRNGKFLTMEDIDEVMIHRIECMLATAHMHGYRELVLGAWGCGAFGHNPYRVACYFREVLFARGYKNLFDVIGFAIIDDKRTDNFMAFVQGLGDFAYICDLGESDTYRRIGAVRNSEPEKMEAISVDISEISCQTEAGEDSVDNAAQKKKEPGTARLVRVK